jgi:hypothetical protein
MNVINDRIFVVVEGLEIVRSSIHIHENLLKFRKKMMSSLAIGQSCFLVEVKISQV